MSPRRRDVPSTPTRHRSGSDSNLGCYPDDLAVHLRQALPAVVPDQKFFKRRRAEPARSPSIRAPLASVIFRIDDVVCTSHVLERQPAQAAGEIDCIGRDKSSLDAGRTSGVNFTKFPLGNVGSRRILAEKRLGSLAAISDIKGP